MYELLKNENIEGSKNMKKTKMRNKNMRISD
jgi:hypothetical protein